MKERVFELITFLVKNLLNVWCDYNSFQMLPVTKHERKINIRLIQYEIIWMKLCVCVCVCVSGCVFVNELS